MYYLYELIAEARAAELHIDDPAVGFRKELAEGQPAAGAAEHSAPARGGKGASILAFFRR